MKLTPLRKELFARPTRAEKVAEWVEEVELFVEHKIHERSPEGMRAADQRIADTLALWKRIQCGDAVHPKDDRAYHKQLAEKRANER